jgi:hydroxymethylpyrimidine/phosphomethylpyrimidine kinase
MKQALTIAGSDSGGGAGIQADIKTMQANGVFAASVVTAVTAQNTVEVRAASEIPHDLIRAQLEAVFDDFDISAAKTGMLASAGVIETVADFFSEKKPAKPANLVVDPVMISKSGYKLLADDAITSLRDRLLPLALVVTPNLPEASLLSGLVISDKTGMREAAQQIQAMGAQTVIVKGGHAAFSLGTDIFYDGKTFHEFQAQNVYQKTVHGTGCTFSAAIAARLALEEPLPVAIENAKYYVTRAIEHQLRIGAGHGPGNHFYFLTPSDYRIR